MVLRSTISYCQVHTSGVITMTTFIISFGSLVSFNLNGAMYANKFYFLLQKSVLIVMRKKSVFIAQYEIQDDLGYGLHNQANMGFQYQLKIVILLLLLLTFKALFLFRGRTKLLKACLIQINKKSVLARNRVEYWYQA